MARRSAPRRAPSQAIQRLACLLSVLLAATTAAGEEPEPPRETPPASVASEGSVDEAPAEEAPSGEAAAKPPGTGFALLPLLYYTPDTRLAFGAAGAWYFRLGKDDEKPRLSFAKLLADYTQNRQIELWGEWAVFLGNEDYVWKGDLRYRNFPDRFYGIGNATLPSAVERYSYDFAALKQLFLKKLRPGVFIGGDFQLTSFFRVSTPGPILGDGSITGSQGGISSGVGAVFLLDTRDNVMNASRGEMLQLSSYVYSPWLGSDFDYVNLNLWASKYWRTFGEQVFAVHAVANLNYGDVPLPALSAVGGEDILRGYARNRFRDRHMVAAQVEYRVPIWWRLGAVVFAGAGDVFGAMEDLAWSRLKPSVGVGVRGAYDVEEKFNVRIDHAWGRDGERSFYLMFGEAF
jgi:hypothetical protein